MDHKLPLLGICQGFQILCQLVVDLFEPAPTDEDAATKSEAELAEWRHALRDGLLSDLKMFRQLRTTKWAVPKPDEFSFLS